MKPWACTLLLLVSAAVVSAEHDVTAARVLVPRPIPSHVDSYTTPSDPAVAAAEYAAGKREWCAGVEPVEHAAPRIALWSKGKGFYFYGMGLFMRAFPGYEIVSSRDKSVHCAANTVSATVVSNWPDQEPATAPPFVPVIVYSGEPFHPWRLQRIDISFITLVSAASQANSKMHWVPTIAYSLSRIRAELPPSLRLFDDDDVGTRPCLVGYINSHCTPQREALFALLQTRLPRDRLLAAGKCAGLGSGVEGQRVKRAPHVAMSDCRLAIAMENSNMHGYVTEKIVNAFAAGAVPIQWGSRRELVQRLGFNPRAFFSLEDFDTLEAAADAVAALALNETRLREMRDEPVSTNPELTNGMLRWTTNNAASFATHAAALRKAMCPHWGCKPSL